MQHSLAGISTDGSDVNRACVDRKFPSENMYELPKEALDSSKPESAFGLPDGAVAEVDDKVQLPDPVVLPGPEPVGGHTPAGQFPGEPGEGQ